MPGRPIGLPLPFGARLRQIGRMLGTFEASFVLLLYSNQLEILLGSPINITILAYALSIAAGVVVVMREGIYARGLPTACLGIVLVLWCVLTFSWSPSRLVAPGRTFELVTFVTWSILAGSLIVARSPERVTRFMILTMAGAVILAAYGAQLYLVYGSFRRLEQFGDDGRVYLSFGRGVGPGAVLAFLIAIYARPLSLRQMLGVAMFGLCSFFLLVGGGRGPFLAVCVACLVPLALGSPAARGRLLLPRSQVITLLLIGLAVLGGVFLIASGHAVDTIKRLVSLASQLGDDDKVSIGTDRVDKFRRAVEGWWRAPVLGNGIGSFAIASLGRETARGDYPHNLILELLFEYGLIGLMLFAAFAWSALRSISILRLRQEPLLLAGLMLLVSGFFNAMVSGEISGNLPVFWGLALLTMRGAASIVPTAAERATRGSRRGTAPARAA